MTQPEIRYFIVETSSLTEYGYEQGTDLNGLKGLIAGLSAETLADLTIISGRVHEIKVEKVSVEGVT